MMFNFTQKTKKLNIVVLLTCRNEKLYIKRCLQHLYEQGVETCLIDNDSTDNTLKLAKKFKRKGLIRIVRQEYKGYFDLVEQLKIKERLVQELDADWFIHHDADEIREAPQNFNTLYQAISHVDKEGYNAINFDEFVFLPTSETDVFENTDYYSKMRYYYFHEPQPFRHIKAFKKTSSPIDIASSGGHKIKFFG